MRAALAAALLATAAEAQEQPAVPNGPWSFGAGIFGTTALGETSGAQGDLAISLALTYEWPNFFAGIEAMAGELAQRRPRYVMGMLRFGLIADWPTAPYVSVGIGSLREEPPYGRESGFAMTGELGVMLFRDHRIGRGTISIMGVAPAFDVTDTAAPGQPGHNIPLVIFGARVLY
jgi:hypothetical protein